VLNKRFATNTYLLTCSLYCASRVCVRVLICSLSYTSTYTPYVTIVTVYHRRVIIVSRGCVIGLGSS